MARSFSLETKADALRRADYRCQICGDPEVDCYQIYSKKLKVKWSRIGGDPNKWMDHHYVRSLDNCIVLCPDCGDDVYSKTGLKEITVQYLESLNRERERCTARMPEGRCRNQVAVSGSYRCQDHLEY